MKHRRAPFDHQLTTERSTVPNRFDYVAYDPTAQQEQAQFKGMFQFLEQMIDALGSGRYQSLAMTKLEEAYAFVGKAIRDQQIARNGGAPLQEERNNG